jgi:hypothetical protein
MRKVLLIVLSVAVLACPKNEPAATSQPAKGNVRTTTVADATDVKNLRVDTVITPAPAYFDKAMLSTKVDGQGNAVTDELVIPKGSPAFFTMYIRESPTGLHTRAVWSDSSNKEVAKEEREMKGAKVATYKLDTAKLAAGKYVVRGYWGGNLAVEKAFDIAAATKKVK